MNNFSIAITGAGGAGLLTSGEIVMKALKNLGFYVHAERDYPSLIKGGHSCFRMNISTEEVHTLTESVDVLLPLDSPGVIEYIDILNNSGILVHGYEHQKNLKEVNKIIEEKNIKVNYLHGREEVNKLGGNYLMINMLLLGLLWKTLGLDLDVLEKEVEKKFASKPALLKLDLLCIEAGYNNLKEVNDLQIDIQVEKKERILLDGNTAIALGAIHCGVRAYYAYPMSPSSSILTYIAKTQKDTDILVKQAEDEITAVQMTLGSMHMGARSLVATSGGGYDLMTETISLSGMIETPLVVVIAQRPGPATGLPTWTAQADLNMSIFSSHGEFPRVVIGVSDPTSCFELIQQAFNVAEEYQIPVIVLSEKTIAESKTTVDMFNQNTIPISRGLVDKNELNNLVSKDRYKFTESGISKRWLPGTSKTVYFANGDEHKEDGTLEEDAEGAKKMIDKRMRKIEELKKNLPEPVVYGDEVAEFSFVGWGSSKNVILDIISHYKKIGVSVNYLHFDYVWPLRTEKLTEFFNKNSNLFLIEGNYQGQLGGLIESNIDRKFDDKLLKYNGRPFYLEDVINFLAKHNAK